MSETTREPSHSQAPQIQGSEVIRVAILGEGFLILLGLFWFIYEPERAYSGWTVDNFFFGLLAPIPLLAISAWLSLLLEEHPESLSRFTFLKVLKEFQNSTITPICRSLSTSQALIIAALSGFGEELFFRGILSAVLFTYLPFWLGLLAVNLIFAAVHFIGSFKKLWPLIPLYTMAGFYFSYLTEYHGSLLIAIVAHALFNFTSLVLNKRFHPSS